MVPGASCGPEKVTHWGPVKAASVLPYWSKAVTVTLKAVPTVGAEVDSVSVKLLRVEAARVMASLTSLGATQPS
jgi:hypothetical protein